MSDIIDSPVSAILQNRAFDFEQIAIPLSPDQKPIRALGEILEEYQYLPGSVVRSILFRTDSAHYILLAIAGPNKADWASLRKYLNERRLTLAEPSEVVGQSGYDIGAVPPLALPSHIRVLVDESLHDYPNLINGSGLFCHAFGLNAQDLFELLKNAKFGKFGKNNAPT